MTALLSLKNEIAPHSDTQYVLLHFPSNCLLYIVRFKSSVHQSVCPLTRSNQNREKELISTLPIQHHHGQSSCNQTVCTQYMERNELDLGNESEWPITMEISRICSVSGPHWKCEICWCIADSVCPLHFPSDCLLCTVRFKSSIHQFVCRLTRIRIRIRIRTGSGWQWISFWWQFGWAVDGSLELLYMARSRGQIPVDVHEDWGDQRIRGLALWPSDLCTTLFHHWFVLKLYIDRRWTL